MGVNPQDAIKKLKVLMDQVDHSSKKSFQNVHQGFLIETLDRFLRARDYDVGKAHKMLVDCLKWRVENQIDKILRKPIFPADVYRSVRDSQLVGLSGYSKEGLPIFAIGVGLSTLDKAHVHDYVQSHIQINEYRDRVILVVKPLLHERTRKKVQVLPGCGRDELLKLYSYIKQQSMINEPTEPIRKGSFHVTLQASASKSKGAAKTIESEFRKYENGISDTLIELEIM